MGHFELSGHLSYSNIVMLTNNALKRLPACFTFESYANSMYKSILESYQRYHDLEQQEGLSAEQRLERNRIRHFFVPYLTKLAQF